MRQRFAELIGLELDVEQKQRVVVARALGTLHNASLLIDDIEDLSVKRRGREAAYLKFGIPLTLNAANGSILMLYLICYICPMRIEIKSCALQMCTARR